MAKKNYGIPYMGSKNRIAVKLIDFLPSSKVLVDLFGGGGAVSDCASQTNKWERIIYNEIALMPYKGFQMALNGEFEDENTLYVITAGVCNRPARAVCNHRRCM